MASLKFGWDSSRALVARKLIDNIQFDPDSKTYGWGQFLNASRGRVQIGSLGTAAACAAIVAAGGTFAIPPLALATLNDLWLKPVGGKTSVRRFAQNPKLAAFAIGLALVGDAIDDTIRSQVRDEIGGRRIGKVGWGDWFISAQDYEQAPHVVPTALNIIALKLLGDASLDLTTTHSYLLDAARDNDRPIEIRALALLGAALPPTNSTRKETASIYRSLAEDLHGSPFREFAYFYEYKHIDESNIKWESEVITFPSGVIFQCLSALNANTLVGSYQTLSGSDQLREHINKSNGVIVTASSTRTHLLPYLWLALYIHILDGLAKAPRRSFALLHAILSPFSDRVILHKLIPTGALLALTALNVVMAEMSMPYRVVIGLVTLIIGSFWGPEVLRRWMPGEKV